MYHQENKKNNRNETIKMETEWLKESYILFKSYQNRYQCCFCLLPVAGSYLAVLVLMSQTEEFSHSARKMRFFFTKTQTSQGYIYIYNVLLQFKEVN